MLRDTHLEAIYVTEYARTQQTAQPSADLFQLRPQQYPRGNSTALVDTIRRHAMGTVLVVGHSNTIPAIVSMLGGPAIAVSEGEFDNFFIVTIATGGTSLLRLRYGNSTLVPAASAMRSGDMLNGRPVVQISFVRSGGFGFPLRPAIKGTISLTTEGGEVSSEAGYHRLLTAEEAEQLRAGADVAELEKAVTQITRSQKPGAADMDHYRITITSADGKMHTFELNTALSSNELLGVSPAQITFLRSIRDESRKVGTSAVKP